MQKNVKFDSNLKTLTMQVHFTGYPANLLLPCEGEDTVKWNFINSLKEVGSSWYLLLYQ